MSIELWRKLPERFLKMKFEAWNRLSHEVKQLLVQMAADQNFQCVFCSEDRSLEVEHDHDPYEGPGDRYTIYNIRGLVCRQCNWHLMVYEKEQSGDYFGWENVSSYISSDDYESYIYIYEQRVDPLIEEAHERRVGCRNKWHRRLILQKFDDWFYNDGRPPSWWLRYKEEESKKIKTPEQALNCLLALMKFVQGEVEKDPNYEPPQEFLKLMIRLKPIFEEIQANRLVSAKSI